MARLIHLNGPPAVGKSTLARRLVADRPGALCLDVDLVVAMVGGWRDDFWGTLPVARRMAAAMAHVHLLSGQDVVLPQLVTSEDEHAPFRAAARDAGADYVDVVLLADPVTSADRFARRARAGADPVAELVGEVVAAGGGDRLLAKIGSDLHRHLGARDPDLVVDTAGRTVEESYAVLQRLLAR